jgi:thiosulfate reductase cytochrome b subunit
MASSGLQIYNATPVFGGKDGMHVPKFLTLGGWLAGGRHWHFAVMSIFILNFLIYMIIVVVSTRWKTRYSNQADLQALVDVKANSKRKIYALHRLLYTFVLVVIAVAVASGLAMYKPVQFDWLVNIAGSWQSLRTIHFLLVPLLLAFTIIHAWMGFRVGGWRIIRSIFWR